MSKKKTLESNLALLDSPTIIIPGCKILDGALGLEINANTEFDSWQEIGKFFGRFRNSSKFMIGDWLRFGEAIYGEKHSQAIEVTGYDYATINTIQWVASKVEFVRRRTNLSWEHHKEVARQSNEDQAKWLEISEQESLTVKELRASIKAGSVVRGVESDEKPAKEKGLVTIEGIGQYARKWIEEASKKQPIDEWSNERRQLVKAELQPIVDFANSL